MFNDTKVLPGLNDANLLLLPVIAGQAQLYQYNWRLEHFVLESKELPRSHTAEHLTEAIKECMSDWNIEESNIGCITIDNASNNVKTVE